jgi:hypothetical protein
MSFEDLVHGNELLDALAEAEAKRRAADRAGAGR